MDVRRLKYVQDVCPLPHPATLPSIEATRFAAEAGQDKTRVTYLPNGFRVTVFKNKILSWHRTFTTNHEPPPVTINSNPSLINIQEWVPSSYNKDQTKAWWVFGIPRLHGIAKISPSGSLTDNWSTQAKRHLKAFKKSGVKIRLGSLAELKAPYAKCHIRPTMRASLWRLTARHVKEHPELIDVLIAENDQDGIIAAFVAGYSAEAKTSLYLLGFYLSPAKKTFAMTGLVETWFLRSQAKGMALCNFGDMCGPNPLPLASDRGYSIFKTHFGINRVWLPKSHWQITIRWSNKNPKASS